MRTLQFLAAVLLHVSLPFDLPSFFLLKEKGGCVCASVCVYVFVV